MLRRRILPLLAAAVVSGTALAAQLVVPASPAAAAIVPVANCKLNAANTSDEHEGLTTDYDTYWLRPQGTRRAAVLFVQFAAKHGPNGEVLESAVVPANGERDRRVSQFQSAATWFANSSHGRMSLQYTFTSNWLQMPPESSFTDYQTFDGQRRYMETAMELAKTSIDFRQHQLVYLVAPRSTQVFHNSPAFIAQPGWGLRVDRVEVVRHGATFGRDIRQSDEGTGWVGWGYKVINHETGHTFGLPDLYSYDPGQSLHGAVGGWDMMGLISGPAPDFFAWHKWKMGWLDDSRFACVQGTGEAPLLPLGSGATTGYKALVVKVDTDPDPNVNRFIAVVVENRQSGSQDGQSGCFVPGLLVYTVDPSVANGYFPIRVKDRLPGSSLSPCADTASAPLANAVLREVNEQVTVNGVTIKLKSKSGTTWTAERI